jgi:hypothetical protein
MVFFSTLMKYNIRKGTPNIIRIDLDGARTA